MATVTNPNDQPDAKSLAHARQQPAVTLVRDVYGGTAVLREARTTYLPQFPKEDNEGYAARLASAVLYNCMKRTVGGLTGMVFRKDPKFADSVPRKLHEHADNIDLTGRSMPVFAKDVFSDGMLDGHAYIFVDMQAVDTSAVVRLADERKLDLRPYWVQLKKQDVLRTRTKNVNGRPLLVEFAYRECTVEPDGAYGEQLVERVRIYRLAVVKLGDDKGEALRVTYEIHKRVKNGEANEWAPDGNGVMSIDRIPLVAIYANRTAHYESEPPLLDLAYENILHYQTRSDRTNSMHITGVPIPITIGMEKDESGKIAVSSNTGFNLPMGGDAKYLEPNGNSLPEMRTELQDIEQRMAALGLAMLQRDTRAAETAEARRIEKSETDSSLSTAARALKAGLQEAAVFHAKWIGLEIKAEDAVSVNMDFEATKIDPAIVRELREQVAAGQLSLETMWEILVRGELYPEGFDAKQERIRIQEDQNSMGMPAEATVENVEADPVEPEPVEPPAAVAA